MTTKTLKTSPKALVALGALMAFLAPKLAQDAKVDLGPALEGVTGKNFGEKKEAIAAGIKKACEGKLAQDASLEDLGNLLDAVGGHKGSSEEEEKGEEGEDAAGGAGGGAEQVCQFLKDKLSPEDYAQVEKMLGGGAQAQDDSTPNLQANAGGSTPGQPHAMDETPEAKAAREKADKDAADKAKLAQDAATKEAVDKATAAAKAEAKAIREAERAVRPYVGELAMDGLDTSGAVYRAAFKLLNVDVKDVHESAFPALLQAQKKPAKALAQDAGGSGDSKSYAERFPAAARLS